MADVAAQRGEKTVVSVEGGGGGGGGYGGLLEFRDFAGCRVLV